MSHVHRALKIFQQSSKTPEELVADSERKAAAIEHERLRLQEQRRKQKRMLTIKCCVHCRDIYRGGTDHQGLCPRCDKMCQCRHCDKWDERYNFRRGLCTQCRTNPKILENYPRYTKYNKEEKNTAAVINQDGEWGDDHKSLPLAPNPISQRYSQEDKVSIFASRYEKGFGIFHPQDCDYRLNDLKTKSKT